MSSNRVAPRADELAAVAVGGVLGALARAGISAAIPHSNPASWPAATFITNVLGCLVLGLVLAFIDARHVEWLRNAPSRARLARPFIATGVLGGFTTFSTFSVEVVRMVRAGSIGLAAVYAVLSVLVGIALFVLGRMAGSKLYGNSPIDLQADEEL